MRKEAEQHPTMQMNDLTGVSCVPGDITVCCATRTGCEKSSPVPVLTKYTHELSGNINEASLKKKIVRKSVQASLMAVVIGRFLFFYYVFLFLFFFFF